jgi:hypothetical protein
VTVPGKHPAEIIAEMLGDPLPPDWQDPLAVQVRQDRLAALAYEAAEAAVELLLCVRQSERVSVDDAPVDAFVSTVLDLEKGWRRYVHDTQRSDAAEIIYGGLEFWAGSMIATRIEGTIEWVREPRREKFGRSAGAMSTLLNSGRA